MLIPILQVRTPRLREVKWLSELVGRIRTQVHLTSKAFFFPTTCLWKQNHFFKRLGNTDNSWFTILRLCCHRLLSFLLLSVYVFLWHARLSHHCGCSSTVSASVRICDPDEQMVRGHVDHYLVGSGGPCWLMHPWGMHQPCLLPALHTQYLMLPVRSEGRTGYQGWIWELYWSHPVPTDPAPGQCCVMVKPLVVGTRQNWISVLTVSFPNCV